MDHDIAFVCESFKIYITIHLIFKLQINFFKGRNEVINSIKSSFRISVLKLEVLFIQIPMIDISPSKQLRKLSAKSR